MGEWMFSPEYQDWLNDLGERIPESWDDDAAIEDIVTRYVRTLEDRCDAAGISREWWADEQCDFVLDADLLSPAPDEEGTDG